MNSENPLSKIDSETIAQALVIPPPPNNALKQAFLSWDSWFGSLSDTDEISIERDQPPEQHR